MKGRSQRLQSAADPPEDWVDGSWIVDCICGVNFDDGEEMVKCDLCGVWEHTRCSRYVKGEEEFACNKCKSKNNRNDSEETEVAQFLVELPTKPVRIESSYPTNGHARRHPFRLWTNNPIEERVHVQGIPGGDPSLFSGLSSVFSQQLWKSSGYVPKKFNFQYREFPCWDTDSNKEVDPNIEEDNENTVDKGAGVLFSLSKESVLASPIATRSKSEDSGYDKKARVKETKNFGVGEMEVRRSQNGAKKEKGLIRPIVIHSGKRKKEESGGPKELSGKKKAKIADKHLDAKKRSALSSKAVFTPTSDAKQLEFYEDRGPKSFKTDIQSVKNRNLTDLAAAAHVLDGHIAVNKNVENPKNNSAASQHPLEDFYVELSRKNDAVLPEDKMHHGFPGVKTSAEDVMSVDQCISSNGIPEIKMGGNGTANNPNGSSAEKVLSPPGENVASAGHGVDALLNINSNRSIVSTQSDGKIEAEEDAKRVLAVSTAPLADVNISQMPSVSANHLGPIRNDMCRNHKNDAALSSTHPMDMKSPDTEQNAEDIEGHVSKVNELSGNLSEVKQEVSGSEVSIEARKSPLGSKHVSRDEELCKPGGSLSSSGPSQLKVTVSAGKTSPPSSMISKLPSSDNSKPSDAQHTYSAGNSRTAVDSNGEAKAGYASSDAVTDENKQDRKSTKGRSSVRVSHSSRTHPAVSKQIASDSKDHAASSSSKSSPAQNVSDTLFTDPVGSLQNKGTSHAQNKVTGPVLSQKVGKPNHTTSQSSSRGNHATAVHQAAVSNSPVALSDEELALLLHQELNSSPRVPRVPRMRQAGSLPQLASQAAATMLIKRTSSAGTKDQNLVPKRKSKESSKESSHRLRELDDEVKKSGRVTTLLDSRRQDAVPSGGTSSREVNGSPLHVYSFKRKSSGLSTSANSGPSSSAEVNDSKLSSMLGSPVSNSDDDFATAGVAASRTLPGLINEIMSKGKRMTYEELCDAVLPHWNSLRKHNGERYAYASHSQAVLDCLRNRHEWAQLVDRGPKTNSSKKRRKVDSDEFDDDDDDSKHRNTREVESRSLESQRDDFPKGKRKARRRRRLTLQGRGIKDLRNRRKAEMLSDEDDGAFSNSSEGSLFSEEEIQGGRGPGSEASSSSEEMR